MTPRQRRMTLVLGIVAGVGIAGALALSAFRSNVTFYFDPTKVAAGEVKPGEHFRLGGMVTKGSVKREPGSLEVHFVVTDFEHNVPVSYTGVLPDLFREGTGVVAHGHLDTHGTFVADEVLAKHDEKYMPPEVAKSLKRRHGEAREEALDGTPATPTTNAAPPPNGAPMTNAASPLNATPTTNAASPPNATPTRNAASSPNTAPSSDTTPSTNIQANATPSPSTGS
jgi:cytochrome c-type biogenesis protein CcmE